MTKKIGEQEEITRRKINLILYNVPEAESEISRESGECRV